LSTLVGQAAEWTIFDTLAPPVARLSPSVDAVPVASESVPGPAWLPFLLLWRSGRVGPPRCPGCRLGRTRGARAAIRLAPAFAANAGVLASSPLALRACRDRLGPALFARSLRLRDAEADDRAAELLALVQVGSRDPEPASTTPITGMVRPVLSRWACSFRSPKARAVAGWDCSDRP
jgi:hypothetical protein